jgi:hypothetical protein
LLDSRGVKPNTDGRLSHRFKAEGTTHGHGLARFYSEIPYCYRGPLAAKGPR